MRIAQRYAAVFILTLVTACAGALPRVETFNQRLIVAVASVTAVRNTTTTLLQAKKITPDDAANVQAGADVARTGLEVARGLSKVSLESAEGKLQAVTVTIKSLNDYLNTRK